MPNPHNQPMIPQVEDTTESYTMLSGLVKRFTFAQVKSWINSWILPTVVGSRVVGTDILLDMSNGSFITIPGIVAINQYQHRYRARFDENKGDILVPVLAPVPYQSSVMIFAQGLKQIQEGNYKVITDNNTLTTQIIREQDSQMPSGVTFEIIVFFSDSNIDGNGGSGTSRLDIIDEHKSGNGTANVTFTLSITSISNWTIMLNGLDEKSWIRNGQTFTFEYTLKPTDQVTLRMFNIL